MKRSRKLCYYCGTPIGETGSTEHVPPQMMFASGTDSITVPSCKKHNQDKSNRDAVIVSFLIRSATKEWRKLRVIPPEVIAAFSNSQQTIDGLAKTHPDVPLLAPLPSIIGDFPDMPYISNDTDIQGWMRQITAGLVYDALKRYEPTINWDTTGVISPGFLENNSPPFMDGEKMAMELIKWDEIQSELERNYWFQGWRSGRNAYEPKIYNFQVSFLPEFVYFRHRFYDTFKWYVRFKATETVRQKLHTKLVSNKGMT